MDDIDKKLLRLLAENADATATSLGEEVCLSVPAVNKRLAKLRQDGIIRSHTIIADSKACGKPICAFILIVIKYGENISSFLEYLEGEEDVLECYAVAGEYDYLIKICATDVESLENKLLYIKSRKGVIKSYTMLSLAEHKFKATALPSAD